MQTYKHRFLALKLWLQGRLRRGKIIFVTLVMALTPIAAVIGNGARTGAVSDVAPVTVHSLSVAANTVTVNSGTVTVHMDGNVTDDLSGFAYARIYYKSPSGVQTVESEFSGAGGWTGQFDYKTTFPQFAEPGLWKPSILFADATGNIVEYTAAQLTALGFNLNMTVVSDTPDITPPVLDSLTQDRTQVDTGGSSDQTVIDAVVSDSQSGFAGGRISYTSPSGLFTTAQGEFTDQVSPGNFRTNSTFLPFAETGHWAIKVTLVDRTGNTKVYDASDLQALGFPSGVEMIGNADFTPPTIHSLDFAPLGEAAQTAPLSGGIFMLKGLLSDNLSGIAELHLTYHSTVSSQVTTEVSRYLNSDPENDPWEFYVYFPPYQTEGLWQPTLTTVDNSGFRYTYSTAELESMGYHLAVNVGETVNQYLQNNETASTDTSGTGATTTDPVQIAVTSPNTGSVIISALTAPDALTPLDGYQFLGEQFTITAPEASVEAPLRFKFTVDASKLSDIAASDVDIFRDGQLISDCINPATADPDACVVSRTLLGNGDVEILVNSSHASVWTIAHEVAAPAPFHFQKFKKPLNAAPKYNKTKGGEAIPVKFSVGGDYGLSILASGYPTSQRIDCDTKQLLGEPTATVATSSNNLTLGGDGFYRYNWKTLKKWGDTCRQFTLKFTTGETVNAYFKFKD